ncbi:aminopeptidase P family protein [Thalassospira sp. HF15]|uniref:M24 family metallopeptidase n=1 Tax=Thalassospira sp. HF15 TaxID=2722755 RepID=UPI001431FBA7|nr:Xaa-Pro peptidase family protein [Thalassospira sp. HF15]NIY74850.1 aminopeptidase P family protein [Thalassospira sp. HF15]
METGKLIPPARGFTNAEFEERTKRLQAFMTMENIGALFVSTEPEFRYFSGFKSQFWESPTRPWFLVIPAAGKPIAVVPEIGVAGFDQTWIDDVRSWPSPRPEDDGISLLTDTLKTAAGSNRKIGAMMGPESHLRMPANNFKQLCQNLGSHEIVDISLLMRTIRAVKSEAEIAKIRFACEVTAAGFDFLRETIQPGMSERDACKTMQIEMLRLGADSCPYLIAASGPGGYDNIIMGPTDRVLVDGDVLIIDAGANFDGYFSDFDRNFAFGKIDPQTLDAYDAVYAATEAGLKTAAPGNTTGNIWRAMSDELRKVGALGNSVGRMGHGLGMQLTEWPSLQEGGDTQLEPGMVLTLEPGMSFAPGKMMVQEENIVITADGCELLHKRTWQNLPNRVPN